MSEAEGIRLQKVLAQAGVGSRRRCEELMATGRVEVNGEVVTQMGIRVDPHTDLVRVDGRRIPPPSDHAYLVLNKPRGVVSSMADEQGRRDLTEFVAGRDERLFHVGRLDTDTSGLLLLTNDGDLAHRLAHPSYEFTKTYVALVDGAGRSLVELDLHMGRNRIVRRMLAAVGHPVVELTRTTFGPIHLGGLGVGRSRELTREELGDLFDSVSP